MTDARQTDAFVLPSRVGGLLEVARDEMLERIERGERVAWIAPGPAGTLVHGWVAVRDPRIDARSTRAWRVKMLGGLPKSRAWTEAEVTRAVAGAEALLDPDSPRVLRAVERW